LGAEQQTVFQANAQSQAVFPASCWLRRQRQGCSSSPVCDTTPSRPRSSCCIEGTRSRPSRGPKQHANSQTCSSWSARRPCRAPHHPTSPGSRHSEGVSAHCAGNTGSHFSHSTNLTVGQHSCPITLAACLRTPTEPAPAVARIAPAVAAMLAARTTLAATPLQTTRQKCASLEAA
jgi:hypothetical protein